MAAYDTNNSSFRGSDILFWPWADSCGAQAYTQTKYYTLKTNNLHNVQTTFCKIFLVCVCVFVRTHTCYVYGHMHPKVCVGGSIAGVSCLPLWGLWIELRLSGLAPGPLTGPSPKIVNWLLIWTSDQDHFLWTERWFSSTQWLLRCLPFLKWKF